MTLPSLITAVAYGLALSGGQLAFAWFFMAMFEDRAALRIASLISLTSVAIAAISWTINMDPALTTWWDVFTLAWLAGLAAGLGLLWHLRTRSIKAAQA
jgi:hypothetical protein